MKNPYEEIERNIARTIDYLTGITGVDSPKQLGELHSMILQALDACMEQKYPLMDTDHITSSEVLLHVKDRDTGRVYSRKLPLDYKENNNGLTLDGETADGKASSIVFYSETAIEKFADITGRGEKHNHSCGEYRTP